MTEPAKQELKTLHLPGAESWKDASSEWTELALRNGRVVERAGRQMWTVVVESSVSKSASDGKDAADSKGDIGAAPTVFLVHGGGGRGEQYLRIIRQFQKLSVNCRLVRRLQLCNRHESFCPR